MLHAESKDHKHTDYQKLYSDYGNEFRAMIDREYGISRTIDDKGQIIRDATGELKAETNANQTIIEKNNMLLRCLGRLRGIDYVLVQKINETTDEEIKNQYKQIRTNAKTFFETLKNSKSNEANDEITFNANLCKILHEANLDKGCSKQKDYEKLLFHYRNLSSLIDPIKPLITYSYDHTNQILHRITQTPITKKYGDSNNIKKDMDRVTLFPSNEEGNVTFQSKQKLAFQEANHYVADLAASDDRMLGAQTRKTHLHGLKNAFVVKNDIFFDVEPEDFKENQREIQNKEGDKSFTYARMATPVYVGKGEADDRVKKAALRNLGALKNAIRNDRDRYAWFNLIGSTSIANLNNETRMRDISEKASETKNIRHVYAPPNGVRMVSGMVLPQDIIETNNAPDTGTFDRTTNKVNRIKQTAKAMLQASNKDYTPIISCASGQDRTTTLETEAIIEWITLEKMKNTRRDDKKVNGMTSNEFARYIENQRTTNPTIETEYKNTRDSVEKSYIASRNAAEITSHVVGGSRGLKSVSSAEGLFSPETDKTIYLHSADTNKENFITSDSDNKIKTRKGRKEWRELQKTLKHSSGIALKEYNEALEKLVTECTSNKNPYFNQLSDPCTTILAELKAIEPISHKHISSITAAVKQAAIVVQNPHDTGAIQRLGGIIKGLNKKSHLRKIANALLFLAGTALVIAGVLAAIPSGGTSLLAVALGSKIIGATAAATAVASLSSTAAIGSGIGGVVIGAASLHQAKKSHEGDNAALSTSLKKLTKEAEKVEKNSEKTEPKNNLDSRIDESDEDLMSPRKSS